MIGDRQAKLKAAADTRTGRARWEAKSGWHSDNFIFQLTRNGREVEATINNKARSIENEIAKHEPRPWTFDLYTHVKKNFQKEVAKKLRETVVTDPEQFLRSKIRHYGFNDRREAQRALERLRVIGKTTPPRVWAATFSFIANRWSTGRNTGGSRRYCLLGCQNGDDDTDHYGKCPVVREFLSKHLATATGISGTKAAMCLTAPPDADNSRQPEYWSRVGLAHYAVLKATNALRHEKNEVANLPRHGRAERCLRAGLAEAIRGSPALKLLPKGDPNDTGTGSSRKRNGEHNQTRIETPAQKIRRLLDSW